MIKFYTFLFFYVMIETDVYKRQTQSSLSIRYFTKKASVFGSILASGFPSMVRQGLASISTMVLNAQAAIYGDAAIAAMSVVSRIFMFIFSRCV